MNDCLVAVESDFQYAGPLHSGYSLYKQLRRTYTHPPIIILVKLKGLTLSIDIRNTEDHGQYDGQGSYCGPSTASEVFLIFITQQYPCQCNYDFNIFNILIY